MCPHPTATITTGAPTSGAGPGGAGPSGGGGGGGRRGRPANPYVTSWGQVVHGLRRRPTDGRWEVTAWWARGRKFTEPDEQKAVVRFNALRPPEAREDAVVRLPRKAVASGLVQLGRATQAHFTAVLGQPIETQVEGEPLDAWHVEGDHATTSTDVLQQGVWTHLRRELQERPWWVAEQAGIPELARLSEVTIRPPSPSLHAVGKLYEAHAPASAAWKRRVARFWLEFRRAVGPKQLRQLTPGSARKYADMVLSRGRSPTYARQRFAAVKGVVHFALRQGLDPGDCRNALDALAVLRPPRPRKPRPQPIDPVHFRGLLEHADPVMRAAVLLGLNACMYAAEVAALDWDDLDLAQRTLVTRRPKTGVLRVAVLWDATVESLTALPSSRLRQGPVLRVSGATVRRRFWDLRRRAGLRGVCFEHLRDGAYTAAVEADGVSLIHAEVLAGHRVGVPDHYIARRPQLVAAACEAVWHRYQVDVLGA